MNKLIVLCFVCIFWGIIPEKVNGSEITDSLFIQGNTSYANRQYDKAIHCYTRVIYLGFESANLYYNLGNAYYKQKLFAYAILYYEKALLLKPGDNDIQQNLALANAHIVDKINAVPEFFLKRWIAAIRDMLGPNEWSHLTIILLVITLSGLGIYKISHTLSFKKSGFICGIICLLLTLISTLFMYSRIRNIRDHESAIIMIHDVSARSSPDTQSTNVFVLHEGTKVMVTDSIKDWKEIRIANGIKGWIPAEAISEI